MKNIVFICLMGMSTSLLVKKVKEAAEKRSIKMNITAMSEGEALRQTEGIDAILLGPQVKYLLPQFKEKFNPKNVSVEVIDYMNYGMLDGDAVLNQILSMISG